MKTAMHDAKGRPTAYAHRCGTQDARLIASAPELLEALQQFLSAMSVGVRVTFRTAEQQREGDAAYAKLKQVVAKVTNA